MRMQMEQFSLDVQTYHQIIPLISTSKFSVRRPFTVRASKTFHCLDYVAASINVCNLLPEMAVS